MEWYCRLNFDKISKTVLVAKLSQFYKTKILKQYATMSSSCKGPQFDYWASCLLLFVLPEKLKMLNILPRVVLQVRSKSRVLCTNQVTYLFLRNGMLLFQHSTAGPYETTHQTDLPQVPSNPGNGETKRSDTLSKHIAIKTRRFSLHHKLEQLKHLFHQLFSQQKEFSPWVKLLRIKNV